MCVVSMIMDHYSERWGTGGYTNPANPFYNPNVQVASPSVSAEEVAEFRRLLDRAREYDKRNSEANCELDSKKTALKLLAKQLGFDISFIDAQNTTTPSV